MSSQYSIDHPSMGGRITGLKCEPPGGTWIADGRYSLAGADGDQTWIIEISATSATGTMTGSYTYVDNQVSSPMKGVKVYVKGKASGVVELRIDDELKARMHLRETEHTYKATTNKGGRGRSQNAPLASLDLVWEPIGRCK